MTERERMLAGELYDASDAELVRLRAHARSVLARYNREARPEILSELLGGLGESVWIEPPFFCDYGENIFVGDGFYANTGCVVLDCARVEIGDRVLFAPNVQMYAATHPVEAEIRASGLECARPITIGDDVWIGGGAIVLPGLAIGDRSVVGAGSVVSKDVPADVLVAGNPARVIRELAQVEAAP